jgi:hypothetical protein
LDCKSSQSEKVGNGKIRRGKKMAEAKVTATDDGFTTVSEGNAEPETKIVMEAIGDNFTGIYLGMRDMPANENGAGYQQARFEAEDGSGEIYFVNANYSLRDGLKTVRKGTVTRFTWTDELDTGNANPMRVYKIETKRSGPVRRSS